MNTTIKHILGTAAILMGAVSLPAKADLTLTVTQNTNLGGVNFSFSKASGVVNANANANFLAGELGSAPLGFASGMYYQGNPTVLAGSNPFQITNIWLHPYSALPGTNGAINQGLNFYTNRSLANTQISDFNGLVINASAIPWSAFVPGTYVLPSYYSGWGTDLGKFTLQVGAAASAVPEPGSLAIIGLGLAGLGFVRRQRKA
jgi:hypothetical protein